MEAQIGGIYRHYKGQLYRVLNIARHSETLEAMIVYEALYPNPSGQIWVRPEGMFLGLITKEGQTIARFAKVATTL